MGLTIEGSVHFDGTTVSGKRFYEYPDAKTEEFELKLVSPAEATYWCAVNGLVMPLKPVKGGTCNANVESLLYDLAKTKMPDRPPHVYVIWASNNPTDAVWARWVKKWSDRTSKPPSLY